jgi:hypothetical protein
MPFSFFQATFSHQLFRLTIFPAFPNSAPSHPADAVPMSLVDLRGHPTADAFGGDELTAGDLLLSIYIQTCDIPDKWGENEDELMN